MKARFHRSRRKLSLLYLDGDLAGSRRKAFEDHLASCAECRRHLDRLAGAWRAPRPAVSDPPPSVWRGIERRISERPVPEMRPSAWLSGVRRLAATAAVAAAVALSAAAGVYLGRAAEATLSSGARPPEKGTETFLELGLDHLGLLPPEMAWESMAPPGEGNRR